VVISLRDSEITKDTAAAHGAMNTSARAGFKPALTAYTKLAAQLDRAV
jgi:hypothetical protein